MHKLLRDFEIETYHLISTRRPDLGIVNKKKMNLLVNFAIPVDHGVKLIESEKKNNYLDLA